MSYAYVGRTGILHAVYSAKVAKDNTDGKVAKIEADSINGYPESVAKPGKGIDVDTRNMTAKYTGTTEYIPLADFPEGKYVEMILAKLK